MDLSPFNDMNEADLKSYLEFLLWHYRVVDAFWFLSVVERFDQATAEKVNETVWAKVSPMAAKNLLERFGIREKGLEGFVKAQKLFPWSLLTGYTFDLRESELILTVPACPVQQARLKRGLSEYVCKEMHRGEFEGFSKVVDPRINVECVFAPPDPHPPDLFCKWRFTLEGE